MTLKYEFAPLVMIRFEVNKRPANEKLEAVLILFCLYKIKDLNSLSTALWWRIISNLVLPLTYRVAGQEMKSERI